MTDLDQLRAAVERLERREAAGMSAGIALTFFALGFAVVAIGAASIIPNETRAIVLLPVCAAAVFGGAVAALLAGRAVSREVSKARQGR